MALPRGAHYVRGSGGLRIRLESGEIVTKHRADTIDARQRFGARSIRELRAARREFPAQMRRRPEIPRAIARGRSEQEIRDTAAQMQIEAKHIRETGRNVTTWQDKSPDGPLARYLTAIGRRPVGADYPVGDTP